MICEESRDAFDRRTYKKQFNSSGIPEFKHLLNCVVDVKYRSELIDNLAKELNFDFGMFKHYLSAEQIGEMSRQGMVFGSHTDSHPVMSRLSRAEQSLELKVSFDYLTGCSGYVPKTYCHPYGGFHSFSADTVDLLAERDVTYSFNVEIRYIKANDWLLSPSASSTIRLQ